MVNTYPFKGVNMYNEYFFIDLLTKRIEHT
ncbi:hypothetical protein FHR24_001143 [Wenyingzhuangia heitensis]|uniref:Uncharacterized protein n=1 Tax=Wenyingzhuangia heitensis TaxID=1487859 RepID=A0ABX0U782_9FLAO|nr:hypothetical protein [Wenyingzhuangia heitensis]